MTDEQLLAAALGGGGADAPTVDEVLAARDAAASTAAFTYDVPEGKIAIYDPDHESLSVGEYNDIQFGQKGGFEPHVWIGEETEQVRQMLVDYPKMVVVNVPNKVYVCEHDGQEFTSLKALQGHRSRVHARVVKQ